MKKTNEAKILATIGAGLAAIAVNTAQANPFAVTALSTGYMVADAAAAATPGSVKAKDGKCGEGKCGANKAAEKARAEKVKDAQCGAKAEKVNDAKCGAKPEKVQEAKCGGAKAEKVQDAKCGGAK